MVRPVASAMAMIPREIADRTSEIASGENPWAIHQRGSALRPSALCSSR